MAVSWLSGMTVVTASPLRAAPSLCLSRPVALIYFTLTTISGHGRTEESTKWVSGHSLPYLVPLHHAARRIGRYALLIDVRRMIGVATFLSPCISCSISPTRRST
jgi:hypothetical protein